MQIYICEILYNFTLIIVVEVDFFPELLFFVQVNMAASCVEWWAEMSLVLDSG